MSASLNEVRVIGRLVRDPELRSTAGGTYVCTYCVAIDNKYKDKDGKMVNDTEFTEWKAWGKLAEFVSKYCKKGRLVFSAGRVKAEKWTDAKSGEKKSRTVFVCSNFQSLEYDKKDVLGKPAEPASPTQEDEDDPNSYPADLPENIGEVPVDPSKRGEAVNQKLPF